MPIYSISQLSRGNGSWRNSRIDRLFLATVECDSSPVTASLVYHDVSFEVYYLCYLLLLLTLSASSRRQFWKKERFFPPSSTFFISIHSTLSHSQASSDASRTRIRWSWIQTREIHLFLSHLSLSLSIHPNSLNYFDSLPRQPFVRFIV
jgi:hypothetical protein